MNMAIARLAASLVLMLTPAFAEGVSLAGTWTLKESTVTYKANHTMKTATGKSKQARGKGRCSANCEFLVAVPVVSFDSGDSNRDLHVLEATRGSVHPLITVRSQFKATAPQNRLVVDFEIDFAGKKGLVKGVTLTLSPKDGGIQVDGSFILRVSDYGVIRPSLFGMAIDDEIPITIESFWISSK